MGIHPKAILAAAAALLATLQPCSADEREWAAWLGDLAAAEEWTTAQGEQAYDLLRSLEESPVDINTASREELEQLPFLTERQVGDIQEHIYRHGPMETLAELQLIESLDYTRRRLLQCFARAGGAATQHTPTLAEELRRGHGELTGAVRLPLYERRGDRNGYLGYKYKHWLRATFTAGDRLRMDLAASQDAGEPLFSGKSPSSQSE